MLKKDFVFESFLEKMKGMPLLAEIHETDLGMSSTFMTGEQYERRQALRAVVFDDAGQVGVVHVSNGDYWKISGGGVESGENFFQTLEREVFEELGVRFVIEREVGRIIEYRDQWQQIQESYCVSGFVKGEKGVPEFDSGEREKGFSAHWLSYEEALKRFREHAPMTYAGKFMQTRDRIFLENVRKE